MGNCLMSTGLCVLLCKTGCQWSKLASLAFRPPKPSSFRIEKAFDRPPQQPSSSSSSEGAAAATGGEREKNEGGTGEYRIIFDESGLKEMCTASGSMSRVVPHKLKTASDTTISALFVKSNEESPSKMCILYSHGNAVDIGQMLPFFITLSDVTGANVFGYEYTGYGDSIGAGPSEQQVYLDIEAAMEKLRILGFPPACVIAVGQSVGSGPTCHLAGRFAVGGVILVSGLLSGLNVIRPPLPGNCCCLPPKFCSPACCLCCFDLFTNETKISQFECPILLIHGRQDEVIHFCHAEELLRRCRPTSRSEPLWMRGAGHNDLLIVDPDRFYQRIAGFVEDVRTRGAVVPTSVNSM